MISDYMKARQMMAENGYEHTPAEAKELIDELNGIFEKFSNYETYLQLQHMTDEEIMADLEDADDPMTLEEFKEVRDIILDICK